MTSASFSTKSQKGSPPIPSPFFLSLISDALAQLVDFAVELAEKLELTNMDILYTLLDIKPRGYHQPFSPSDPKLPKYRELSSSILKENSEIVNEIKALEKKIPSMEKKITLKLESFMKTNALRLEAKQI